MGLDKGLLWPWPFNKETTLKVTVHFLHSYDGVWTRLGKRERTCGPNWIPKIWFDLGPKTLVQDHCISFTYKNYFSQIGSRVQYMFQTRIFQSSDDWPTILVQGHCTSFIKRLSRVISMKQTGPRVETIWSGQGFAC